MEKRLAFAYGPGLALSRMALFVVALGLVGALLAFPPPGPLVALGILFAFADAATVAFAMGILTELEEHGADLAARPQVGLDDAVITATAGIPAALTFGPADPYTVDAQRFAQATLDGLPNPVPPADAVPVPVARLAYTTTPVPPPPP